MLITRLVVRSLLAGKDGSQLRKASYRVSGFVVHSRKPDLVSSAIDDEDEGLIDRVLSRIPQTELVAEKRLSQRFELVGLGPDSGRRCIRQDSRPCSITDGHLPRSSD